MPTKKGGLDLQNPVTLANAKYLSLICAISELIGAVTVARESSTANHLLALREERRDRQKIQDDTTNAKLKGIVEELEVTDRHLILRAKNTGSWMDVHGTTVTDTVLAAMEFVIFVCIL